MAQAVKILFDDPGFTWEKERDFAMRDIKSCIVLQYHKYALHVVIIHELVAWFPLKALPHPKGIGSFLADFPPPPLPSAFLVSLEGFLTSGTLVWECMGSVNGGRRRGMSASRRMSDPAPLFIMHLII